ncbi:MAG TPA: putative lipid II flippase FtsW [Polyangiaceae bacterium]|jgi:cell division protein FtsW|nr:putative lipid II flippase FtsW [Polyangiaceae bacterium]
MTIPWAAYQARVQRREDGPIDPVLAAVVIALIGFGVVMVYSASAIEAAVQLRDPQFYLKKQGFYAVIALALMWVTSHVDYHRYRRHTYTIFALVTVLMLLCVLGLGHMGGGARRWLALGPIHVQPAEMAKLGLVLWLSYSLSKKADKIRTFLIGFVPHLIMAGFLMFLCLKQPDFGSAVVLLFLTFTMLFVAGAKIGYLLGGSIVGAVAGIALIFTRSYRLARYLAWLDMDKHRQDVAYQPFQSVMSFGSGGAVGLGLGRGLQVLYLPEAHTDFIAAIVGEELGFVGVLGLCAAYLVVVSRGVRIALLAEDDYGSFIAFGISTMFGVQALVNLAVAMAILPTKGLTLPFVSYGGSSLLVNAVATGILLNVSRRRSKPRDMVSEGIDAPEASALVVTSAGEGA